MADSHDSAEEEPVEMRSSYVRVKEGHPRFNLLVLLVLLAAFIAIALVEAQRLQL